MYSDRYKLEVNPKLDQAFRHILKTFFHRANIDNSWVALECLNLPEGGACIYEERKILIGTQILKEEDNKLYCVLIHEICHATVKNIVGSGHGCEWNQWMVKAIIKAHMIHNHELARLLSIEIQNSKSE